MPFVGRAGQTARDSCSAEIGLQRSEVFIANTLMCRPPGNRDPLPIEIENCHEYLLHKVELIQPDRDLHARQLLDEAPARRPDGHHAPARPAGGADARRARRAAVPDLPPGGRAIHAADARDAARGLRAPARAARAGRAGAAGVRGRPELDEPRQAGRRSWRRAGGRAAASHGAGRGARAEAPPEQPAEPISWACSSRSGRRPACSSRVQRRTCKIACKKGIFEDLAKNLRPGLKSAADLPMKILSPSLQE